MPSFRIINTNASNNNQEWTTFIDQVEQDDFQLGPGAIRGNGQDDVWQIDEDFRMGYTVSQMGNDANTELRYTAATNTWALNPQINPFVLTVAAPVNGITNVTLSCG